MSDAADSSSPVPPDKQTDVFGPPSEPIEVHCLHCNHVYMSDLIVPVEADDGSIHYACPVPNCSGMGFGFDIHPADPTWCSEETGYFQTWDDDEPLPFEDDGDPAFSGDRFFDEDDDSAGEFIAREVSDSEGHFDPPRDWTPDADREDGDIGEFDLFAPEGSEDDDAIFDDPDAHYIRPEPKHFTREDYEKAKAEGVYDRLAESIRQWWNTCDQHCQEHGDGGPFKDDDIPF